MNRENKSPAAGIPQLWIARVGVPLMVGGMIYVLFRPRELLFFRWIDSAGLGTWIDALRERFAEASRFLPDFAIYSLPNALWLFAFVSCLSLLWRENPGPRRLWATVPIALGIGPELGQLLGWVPGTFDLVDLSTAVVAIAVALGIAEARRAPLALSGC